VTGDAAPRGRARNRYTVVVNKLQGKREFAGSRHSFIYNIKMMFRGQNTRSVGLDSIVFRNGKIVGFCKHSNELG
jgi:hypothetical protein